jgi:UrcA family protein
MLRIITATALFALIATAADAGDASPPSTIVRFSDLNLSHPADAKILAGRLEVAAKQVCREEGSGQTGVAAMKEMRACTDAAIGMALARIQSAVGQAVRAQLAGDRQTLASN